MKITVQITGKYNNKDFCAGMILRRQTNYTKDNDFMIEEIAPILKKHFFVSTPITLGNIRNKCKKNKWLVEIELNGN
jgi:hypothetical protein